MYGRDAIGFEMAMRGIVSKPKLIDECSTAPFIPQLKETVDTLLHNHGIEIEVNKIDDHTEHLIIKFPQGTTEEEIFPRTVQARYCITLPDGYQLYRMGSINRKELSIISVNTNDIPKALRDVI
jgi:hypothetical protein